MRLRRRRSRARSLLQEAEALSAQTDRLARALVLWTQTREADADPPAELEELAQVFAVLDRSPSPKRQGGVRQRLGLTTDALGQLIGARLPVEADVPIEGVGVLRRTMSGRSYAWTDGARLAHIIAARAADEYGFSRDDGAQVPPGVLAGAVADELIACAGLDNRSGSWRSTELRGRRINPSDHRVVRSEGRLGARWMD